MPLGLFILQMEHKITLTIGYTDPKTREVHKEITFGRRLTGKDLMLIDGDPQAQKSTQYADLVKRKAMTAFGTMKGLPASTILLSLNRVDRADISRGFEEFIRLGREGTESSFPTASSVILFFGFEIEGVRYRYVELDRLPTGFDELAADNLNLDGLARELFLLGRSISKISTLDDEPLTLNGPLELTAFENLDSDDIHQLRQGAAFAEAYFRITGGRVPEKREGNDGASADAGNGNDGSGNSESADAEAK